MPKYNLGEGEGLCVVCVCERDKKERKGLLMMPDLAEYAIEISLVSYSNYACKLHNKRWPLIIRVAR